MNTPTDEYLSETSAPTNGGNGNGNGKKAFVLRPPQSPEEIEFESINKRLPALRRECSRDKRLKKHVGAKWLFDKLTDLSMMFTFGGDCRGHVRISERDLERIFGVHRTTITRWRLKLTETGWVWYCHRWPRSLWGICGLCRPPEDFVDLVAGGEDLETAQKEVQEVTRTPGGSKSAGNDQNCRMVRPTMSQGTTSDDSGSDQTGLTVRPVVTQEVTSGGGQMRPDWTHGTTLLDSGSDQTGPQDATSLATGSDQLRSLRSVKDGEGESSLSVQRGSTLKKPGKTASKNTAAENVFLLDVKAMMDRWKKGSSKAELENSGAWWRMAFRADRELMRRVLADTWSAVKESRVKTTPGQMAVDTWKLWGGTLPAAK